MHGNLQRVPICTRARFQFMAENINEQLAGDLVYGIINGKRCPIERKWVESLILSSFVNPRAAVSTVAQCVQCTC